MRGRSVCGESASDVKHHVVTPLWGLVVLLAGVVTFSGCGGDDGGASTSSPPPARPVAAPATPPVAAEVPATVESVADHQPAAATPATPQPQTTPAIAPAGESPFEMSYLDPATELFVFARPAAITSSPIVQALTGGKFGPLDDLREQFGLGIDQIESVTIGVSQLQQMNEQNAEGMAAMPGASAASGMPTNPMVPPMMSAPSGMAEHTIIVVRTAAPLSLEEINLPQGDGLTKTHESKTYHQLAVAGENAPHLYAADETTFIVATEAAVQAIIDQGDSPSQATADLSFVPTASHVIVAVVPQDREAFFKGMPAMPVVQVPEPVSELPATPVTKPGYAVGGIPDEDDEDDRGKGKKRRKKDDDDDTPQVKEPEVETLEPVEESEWQKLVKTHVTGIALQIDLNADLQINISANCDIPASALRIQKELDTAVAEGKQMFEVLRSTLPGLVQEIAQSMIDSLAVSADGTTVSVSTTLPESQQANLTMLPTVAMGMMMMSQAGNVEVMQQMVDWQERAQDVLDEGQLSVLSEGVPEGLEVHGLARWSLPLPGREFSPPLLELAIVCTGGPAAHVKSFGRLKVTEANIADEMPIKWLGVSRNGRTDDPLHELIAVDQGDGFTPHPPKGVATGFLFHPPGEEVPSLEVVAGVIVLEVPTSLREITLSNVSGSAVSIDDPTLQSANFVVTTETVDAQAVVQCTYDKQAPFGQFTVLDASGNSVEASSTSQVLAGDQIHRKWQLPQGTKQPLGLVVAVREDVQEVSVPFRFENLPMPEPASDFSGQLPLRSWTAANTTSEFPEGLTLQAQARWNVSQSPQMASLGLAEQRKQGRPPATSPPPPLTGSGGGPGFGLSRKEEKEDRRRSAAAEDDPGTGSGTGLSRSEEKEQRKKRTGNGGEVTERRSGIRIADDDGEEETVRTPEARAAQLAGSLDGRLQFVVDLIGPTIDSTVVIGEMQVDKAIAEGGLELEYEGGQFGQLDVTDDLADVEWDQLPKTDQPPNGLRVIYKFTRPESPIETITEFQGTLQIRTVRERIEAVVPNLNDRTDKRLKDRILSKYGIEIAVAINDDELKYRTLKGDEERLDKLFPVDDEGTRIDGVTHLTTTDNGNRIHVFRFPRDVPDGVGLKFILNLGVEDIEVPVEFSDVPVPPAPPQFVVQ